MTVADGGRNNNSRSYVFRMFDSRQSVMFTVRPVVNRTSSRVRVAYAFTIISLAINDTGMRGCSALLSLESWRHHRLPRATCPSQSPFLRCRPTTIKT